ncbi:MAG TPA: hypothetical protein VFJ90_12225, partial [Candidatus Didemnitutus sp.]|nr:hypothetical protein [Candidatus Didemnitutus sp.]
MNASAWRENYERVLLAGAVVALLVSMAWWCIGRGTIARLRREPVAVRVRGESYKPAPAAAVVEPGPLWPRLAEQARGDAWRYEVFTPPTIYYRDATKSFVVTPPEPPAAKADVAEVELVEVRRQPYRLQLLGMVDTPAGRAAALGSVDRAETFVVHAGEKLAEFDVTLESVESRKRNFRDAEGQPAVDFATEAVLFDESTGEKVQLDSRTRRYTGKLVAVLRQNGDGAVRLREIAVGESWIDGPIAYRLSDIQFEPPQVILECSTDGREA